MAEIKLFKVFMPDVIEPLRETLFSGYIGEGERVKEFERDLSPWFGSENILTVNSCTSAIQLALRLAGVKAGDEVISTPMTCTATNMPILALGGKIVWADINPWTGNIDPKDVAKKITEKTKAIVCVHWGGYPCDLDKLNEIAGQYGIKVIEDAAHAFGSQYHGRPIGSHSAFTCFSFQAIKTITTVDGGALVCKSKDDYERGKLLRWYGIDRNATTELRSDADIKEYGYKFHMNDVAATIGLEQLKYVSDNLKKTRRNALRYEQFFLLNQCGLLHSADRESSYWLYTIRVKNRDKFIKKMKDFGIATSRVLARNDLHTCFKDSRTSLPGLDEFDSEQVSIPVGWWVDEIDYIAEKVCEWQTK
jgi:dTDP-4-amino-4,6-dideoxygalactose transaminase